jgi:hypothetical protein
MAEAAAAKILNAGYDPKNDESYIHLSAFIESLLTAQAEGCVKEWVIYGGDADAANAIRDADPEEVT